MHALELHITGPGLDTRCQLQPGEREMVMGRDAKCGLRLPDPQRNVSRRHVAVWNLGGELHFRVLSAVNGVDVPSGNVGPGSIGVVAPGQALVVADYRVEVQVAVTPEPDPWAVFDGDASGTVAMSRLASPPPAALPATTGDDDPFGDWGFNTTFGPGAPGGGPLEAGGIGIATDIAPFMRGLGLDPAAIGPLSEGELHGIGEMVRMAMTGIFELHRRGAAAVQDSSTAPEDDTLTAGSDANPLDTTRAADAKLRFLFGGRATSAGFIRPERALQALLADLDAQRRATDAAVRAAIEGTLREFEPEALRSQLLGTGGKLFEGARAWEAFGRHWRARATDMPSWVQQLLDNYFTETYAAVCGKTLRAAPRSNG